MSGGFKAYSVVTVVFHRIFITSNDHANIKQKNKTTFLDFHINGWKIYWITLDGYRNDFLYMVGGTLGAGGGAGAGQRR